MKTSIIFSLLLIIFCFACNKTKSSDNISQNGITITDTVRNITVSKNNENIDSTISSLKKHFIDKNGLIQAKNTLSSDQTGLYVYFQAPDEVAKNLRIRIQSPGNSVYKFIIDGKEYIYKANKSQESNERFVGNESIKWYDERVKKEDLKFLEALISSKNAQLYSGEDVITINNQTKINIKTTLDYFEALDGLLPKTNMVNIRR